jgi:NAD(P)-dependent dehydrogenase (short-subunit alcohol dehydrogenase family)
MENLILKDQVALVTGGGRGLGRAIALHLAQAGARVAVSARSSDQIGETVHLIESAGGAALAVTADVSDPAAVGRMIETVQQKLGPVDVLVNNAGTGGPFGPIWENDPLQWWNSFEVNVRGPFLCCHAILPGMVERRRGRIINVASGAGTRPIPYMSSYVAGKCALIRFTEVLAAESESHGVAAFSIQPGTVRTAMADEILRSPEALRWFPWFKSIFDEGKNVPPDFAANLVLYLASGRADMLSGRFFIVPEDPNEVVKRADEVKREDLYAMRLRRLS